jgi:hypothetical protein
MFQHVHPNRAVGCKHARVPGDGCAGVVAAHAAGGAVGHDVQANAGDHEVEGAGCAVDAASVILGTLIAAGQSALMAGKHISALPVLNLVTLFASDIGRIG